MQSLALLVTVKKSKVGYEYIRVVYRRVKRPYMRFNLFRFNFLWGCCNFQIWRDSAELEGFKYYVIDGFDLLFFDD